MVINQPSSSQVVAEESEEESEPEDNLLFTLILMSVCCAFGTLVCFIPALILSLSVSYLHNSIKYFNYYLRKIMIVLCIQAFSAKNGHESHDYEKAESFGKASLFFNWCAITGFIMFLALTAMFVTILYYFGKRSIYLL